MPWTLITGSAKRLGACLALELAKAGHHLVLHYRNSRQEAEDTARLCQKEGVEAVVLRGDFSTPEGVADFLQRYLQKFEHTGCVIHNVGNYLVKPLLATALAEWQSLFQTNLTTAFQIMQALVPSLKRTQGAILHIGSAGLERRTAGVRSPVYNLTKMSLLHLTRTAAQELAPFQVRVNMVSPGQLTISEDLPPDLTILPMQRAGEPQEVARAVLFLLDPANRYITGQNIEVAGGYCL